MSSTYRKPVSPAVHVTRPSGRKKSRSLLRRFSLHFLALGFAAVLLGIFVVQMARENAKMATLGLQRTELQAQLAQAEAKGAELRKTLEAISDDKYLEGRARDFGYIKNGEIALVAQPVTDGSK